MDKNISIQNVESIPVVNSTSISIWGKGNLIHLMPLSICDIKMTVIQT